MLFLPISDYWKTTRKKWTELLVSVGFGVASFFVAYFLFEKSEILNFFDGFVNTHTSIVAILLAFSIAIVTILFSSDSGAIKKLKETNACEQNYKQQDEQPLNLFQILLSNITYNVYGEIIFLGILIAQNFLHMILPLAVIEILIAVDIFFITYILIVLCKVVVRMYLVFWKKE